VNHEIENKKVVNESLIASFSGSYSKIGRKSLHVRVTSYPTSGCEYERGLNMSPVEYIVRKGRKDRQSLKTTNYSSAVAHYNTIEV
jgi:hypothetical protein